MLTGKDYSNGAFKREVLCGAFLYDRFYYEDIFIDKSKGNNLVKDYLAEKILDTQSLNAYYEVLRGYFHDFSKINYKTNGEIFGDISKTRRKFFPEGYYLKKEAELERELSELYRRKNHDFKELLMEGAYTNKTSIEEKFSIDRVVELKRDFDASNERVFIPGEVLQLSAILKLIKSHYSQGVNYIFLKRERTKGEALLTDFNKILSEDRKVENLYEEGVIQAVLYETEAVGIDLRNLSEEAEIIIKRVSDKKSILALGEDIAFSLDGSELNYYLVSRVESPNFQYYTNLFLDSDKKLPAVAAFIPEGFRVAKDFYGTERVKINLSHFDRVYFSDIDKNLLEKNKDNILRLKPELCINFYSNDLSPSIEKTDYIFKENEPILEYGERLKNIIVKREFEKRGLKYINSYYSYKGYEKEEYPLEAHEEQNGVLVRGVVIEDQNGLKIQSILAEDFDTGIISVREVLKKDILKERFYLYNNLLYFFTENLVRLYNGLRAERPYEQIKLKDFYLGYKYESGKGELFPLYNKGYVGFKSDGEVFYGRKKLTGGMLKIGNLKYDFDRKMINDLRSGVAIITPEILTGKEVNASNYREFSYLIGEGRLNIVIINNQIVCVRKGEVSLPSVGIVLSIGSTEVEEKFLKEFDLEEIEKGYYDVSNTTFNLEVETEKTAEEREASLMLGGGTLLVKDGVNLVKTEEDEKKNFSQEGWYNPLSMQTQETQVQKWVRGPRSVIGKTIDGKMFMAAFSGRHFETSGARFDEVVEILQREVGPIKDLLNLDGGASVCFAMVLGREVFELSVPAPSDITCRGLMRPVNSMLLVTQKSN